MTQTHQDYLKELTRLLVEKFPTLESAEEFSRSMGFEPHDEQTHSKFAKAFEDELSKVLSQCLTLHLLSCAGLLHCSRF